jgi:hypothetical protein
MMEEKYGEHKKVKKIWRAQKKEDRTAQWVPINMGTEEDGPQKT